MRISVRLFAGLRDAVGLAALDLTLPAGATVAAAWDALVADHPALAGGAAPAYAVNRAYAAPEQPLRDGDELALIPPVSGG